MFSERSEQSALERYHRFVDDEYRPDIVDDPGDDGDGPFNPMIVVDDESNDDYFYRMSTYLDFIKLIGSDVIVWPGEWKGVWLNALSPNHDIKAAAKAEWLAASLKRCTDRLTRRFEFLGGISRYRGGGHSSAIARAHAITEHVVKYSEDLTAGIAEPYRTNTISFIESLGLIVSEPAELISAIRAERDAMQNILRHRVEGPVDVDSVMMDYIAQVIENSIGTSNEFCKFALKCGSRINRPEGRALKVPLKDAFALIYPEFPVLTKKARKNRFDGLAKALKKKFKDAKAPLVVTERDGYAFLTLPDSEIQKMKKRR
jgi:hypothetical protein